VIEGEEEELGRDRRGMAGEVGVGMLAVLKGGNLVILSLWSFFALFYPTISKSLTPKCEADLTEAGGQCKAATTFSLRVSASSY